RPKSLISTGARDGILLLNILDNLLVRCLLAEILILLSIGQQPQCFDRRTMWMSHRQRSRPHFPDWIHLGGSFCRIQSISRFAINCATVRDEVTIAAEDRVG